MEVNYEILVQIGKELMQSGKLINHLGK
jgi:hypothetical protein